MKPTYFVFYKNNMCLEKLLSDITQFRINFCNKTTNYIEWEHYKLTTIKCNDFNDILQGHGIRVWGIFIEKELYDNLNKEYPDYIQDVLKPMITVYDGLGIGIKII